MPPPDRTWPRWHTPADVEPDNYLNFYKRATVYLATGRTRQAMTDLVMVLKLRPDFNQVRGASSPAGFAASARSVWRCASAGAHPFCCRDLGLACCACRPGWQPRVAQPEHPAVARMPVCPCKGAGAPGRATRQRWQLRPGQVGLPGYGEQPCTRTAPLLPHGPAQPRRGPSRLPHTWRRPHA